MSFDYKLVILGHPKAQGRPRGTTIGRHVQIYDDPKSAAKKRELAVIIQEQAPKKPLTCPLLVVLHFYFPYLKGHYRTGKYAGELKPSAPKYHIVAPDLDNLAKLVLDAMTGIFWRDDSIICDMEIRKIYSESPRIEIGITKIEDEN